MYETIICEQAKKILEYMALESLVVYCCGHPDRLYTELRHLDNLSGCNRHIDDYDIPQLIAAFKRTVRSSA